MEFSQLLVHHSESLRPFAFTLTRDSESAQDLVQETLFRALTNKEKYRLGTNIKAWMYTIMRNIFINDYRKKARHRTVFDYAANDFLIDNRATVTNAAQGALEVKEIQRAVHALPEIFKRPFEMYFEGYRYHEIAGLLKEPLGTVKSRIHFARKLLKEQLSRY